MKKKPHTVSDADLVEFLSGLHSSASPEFESYRKAWKLAEQRYKQGKGFKSRFVVKTASSRTSYSWPSMTFAHASAETMRLLKEMGFPEYDTPSVDRVNVFNMPSLTRTATFFALVEPEAGEGMGTLNAAQSLRFMDIVLDSSTILATTKIVSFKKP